MGSFKQRTIDNKIKVYDALISQWVKMRNFIYTHHPGQPAKEYPFQIIQEFDQIYGESQRYIGEAILVCEDVALTADINDLNEKMYRSGWLNLPLEQADAKMEEIKSEAIALISRMREDIKVSTRFEWHDFVHILICLADDYTSVFPGWRHQYLPRYINPRVLTHHLPMLPRVVECDLGPALLRQL